MVDRNLLADRRIELVGDQAARDVPGEIAVAGEIGEVAPAPALVGQLVRVADAGSCWLPLS